jgi:hypothetical protein
VWAVEWLQHQVPNYDIQSLDIVQMSRPPIDYSAFTNALAGHPIREWELTNNRFILTLAPVVELMNQHMDPVQRRFRLHTAFSLSQTSEGYFRVETNSSGPFGLVEFTGALPRAVLFKNWRGGVPDEEALGLIASTNFNPHAEVLVAEAIAPPGGTPEAAASPTPAGTVSYKTYSPKRFVLDTDAGFASVLLVNDKHDPSWKVTVDGKPVPLLRANFIMRAVELPAGPHVVEFRFEPPTGTLWISLGAMAVALGLCGYVVWAARGKVGTPPNVARPSS